MPDDGTDRGHSLSSYIDARLALVGAGLLTVSCVVILARLLGLVIGTIVLV